MLVAIRVKTIVSTDSNIFWICFMIGCIGSLPASFMVWIASPEAAFMKGKYAFANWDVEELKERGEEIQKTALLSFDLVGSPWHKV